MFTRRRFRFSLLAGMLVVALAAVVLGLFEAERRGRLAKLSAEYERQADRTRWAGSMRKKGYLSNAQFISETARLKQLERDLARLGVSSQ